MSDELNEAAQTATEHVAASAADPGGAARTRPSRAHTLESDTPDDVCSNCGTKLQGPICHQCGQVADAYRRPVHGLLGEIFESLFAFDGRVARTIPNLLFRPGRVTRLYLKGARARFMPPFRLYIIASLIFFLLIPALDQVFSDTPGQQAVRAIQEGSAAGLETAGADIEAALESGDLTPEEADQARAVFRAMGLPLPSAAPPSTEPEREGLDPDAASPGPDAAEPDSAQTQQAEPEPAGEGAQPPASTADAEVAEAMAQLRAMGLPVPDIQTGPDAGADADAVDPEPAANDAADLTFGFGQDNNPDQIRRFFAPEDFGQPAPEGGWPLPVRRYLGERFAEVAEDPEGWLGAVSDWIPRIMFVMVPVYALLLSLVYVWRRGFFFYDHLIVSMHFHSALFLSMAVILQIGAVIGGGWAALIMLIYANAYLYRLHRRVYGRGRFSSLLRTLTLDVMYSVVLSIGFVAVLLLGAVAG